MTAPAHALTRVNPMPTGAVAACKCGWSVFLQDADVTVAARNAIKAHKVALSGRKVTNRQLDRKIATEARRAAELATAIAEGDRTPARDLLATVEALIKFIKETNAS